MNGFIKIHRKLLNWEWFTDVNTAHLFLYILCKANWDEEKWQGIVIPRGSFVTSLPHISAETGLTIQNIRTCLKRLKSTKEITYTSTNKYTLISVNKWDSYQCLDELTNTQINTLSNIQSTFNQQQMNNIKNIKNLYIDKEKKKYIKKKRNDAVDILPIYDDSNNPTVSDEDLNKLLGDRNVS